MYPEVAIREFVANALIHQDFSIGDSSPMIEVFGNRMEITNPGKPLIDVFRFIDHTPISRNENYSMASRIISDTISAGYIKLDDMATSKKYSKYIPFWA